MHKSERRVLNFQRPMQPCTVSLYGFSHTWGMRVLSYTTKQPERFAISMLFIDRQRGGVRPSKTLLFFVHHLSEFEIAHTRLRNFRLCIKARMSCWTLVRPKMGASELIDKDVQFVRCLPLRNLVLILVVCLTDKPTKWNNQWSDDKHCTVLISIWDVSRSSGIYHREIIPRWSCQSIRIWAWQYYQGMKLYIKRNGTC